MICFEILRNMVKLKNILYLLNINSVRVFSTKPGLNAVFFGSDNFSLYSLKLLYNHHIKSELLDKLEVVTNVTKKGNAIQKFAENHSLPLHNWPNVPTDTIFDVGIVVSFGYLIPESTINKFPYGVLNVHASLLPKWRGAAPIIYAIANGDTETGVTIMRIKPNKFDIGDILLQEKLPIHRNVKMLELHQCLGELGARCLVQTLQDLPQYLTNSKPQSNDNVTYAPKIDSNFTTVKWKDMTSVQVYNLYRALSGFLLPTSTWHGVKIKLSGVELCDNSNLDDDSNSRKPGFVEYNSRTKKLNVLCADKTCVSVKSIGLFGKKMMSATDFKNGFLTKKVIDLRYFI